MPIALELHRKTVSPSPALGKNAQRHVGTFHGEKTKSSAREGITHTSSLRVQFNNWSSYHTILIAPSSCDTVRTRSEMLRTSAGVNGSIASHPFDEIVSSRRPTFVLVSVLSDVKQSSSKPLAHLQGSELSLWSTRPSGLDKREHRRSCQREVSDRVCPNFS